MAEKALVKYPDLGAPVKHLKVQAPVNLAVAPASSNEGTSWFWPVAGAAVLAFGFHKYSQTAQKGESYDGLL